MSNIQPYSPSGGLSTFSSRNSRTVGRELSRIGAVSSMQLARVEAAAELQAATIDAVAFVGRKALQDVAMLSQIETQLAQAVPHASGRLAAIADLTAIAMSEVVADTARSLRRA
jgi:hypothetical protein